MKSLVYRKSVYQSPVLSFGDLRSAHTAFLWDSVRQESEVSESALRISALHHQSVCDKNTQISFSLLFSFKFRTHICLIFLFVFFKKYVLHVSAHFYFSHSNLKFIRNMKYEKTFPFTCSLRGEDICEKQMQRQRKKPPVLGHLISGT